MLAGGLIALHHRPRRPLLVGNAALLLIALPLCALALSAGQLVIAAAAFAAGVGVEFFEVLWATTLAEPHSLQNGSPGSARTTGSARSRSFRWGRSSSDRSPRRSASPTRSGSPRGVVVASSTAVMLFGGVRQLVDAPTVAVEPPQRRALAA
jgi:hypothetical protein